MMNNMHPPSHSSWSSCSICHTVITSWCTSWHQQHTTAFTNIQPNISSHMEGPKSPWIWLKFESSFFIRVEPDKENTSKSVIVDPWRPRSWWTTCIMMSCWMWLAAQGLQSYACMGQRIHIHKCTLFVLFRCSCRMRLLRAFLGLHSKSLTWKGWKGLLLLRE